MSHTFILTCALAASLAVAWASRTNKAIWGWLGGFAVGMATLARPLDGFIMAGVLGLRAIGVGGRRLKLLAIVGVALGSTLIGSAIFPYNKMLTGDAAKFPIMAYFDKYYGPKTNAFGFGPERGMGWPIDPYPGHGPIDALVNTNLNTFSLNIELLGWSTGSLILVAFLLFSGSMRGTDYWMLAIIGAIAGLYSFYYFSGGPDFGARYWYLMFVPLITLTARSIESLEKILDLNHNGPTGTDVRVLIAVLSLCLFTLVNYFPWRAIDKYHHYRGMRPDIRYLAKEYAFGKSIVLIQGSAQPDYASAATYNRIDHHSDVPIYAWYRDLETFTQLLEAYPKRPVWIVEGPSITRRGYEVIKGPLSRDQFTTHSLIIRQLPPHESH